MVYFDYEQFKKGLYKNPQYLRMIDEMKKEVSEFSYSFSDHPSKLSAWGHHYFCPDDGGHLQFDLRRPFVHVCEICGKTHTSELFDNVWVYYYRNTAILTIWKSAFLYKVTEEKKYLDIVYKLLNFYADNYEQFAIHDKNGKIFDSLDQATWGVARMMPQSLNESIITVRIINALELIKDDIKPSFKKKMHEFFRKVYKVLSFQVDKIHNIACWINSAIGMMGLFFDDPKWKRFAFEGRYNIYNQIDKGVTEDKFWFEGSIHYNFFTLEGVTNLLLFATIYKYPFDPRFAKVIEDMFIQAYNYAFDNLVLPNPNDGWPNISLKTYSYIYTIATKIFGEDSKVGNLLKIIETYPIERVELPLSRPYYYKNLIPLERIIFTPNIDFLKRNEVKTHSINFQASQYAILKNKNVNLFIKYGHNGPSHAHPDKMNIEFSLGGMIISRDLSNAGYGNKYCNEWHRITASHNTVVINGINQVNMLKGKTLAFNNKMIKVRANNVYHPSNKIDLVRLYKQMNSDELYKYMETNYGLKEEETKELQKLTQKEQRKILKDKALNPQIDFERKIEINDFGFTDNFISSSDKPVIMDYFMHVEADLISRVHSSDAQLDFTDNGYQHIKNVKKLVSNRQEYALKWRKGDKVFKQYINLRNKTLYLADTYDNPITKFRKTIIVRYHGTRTTFKQSWEMEE